MKKTQRLLCLLLAVVLASALLPTTAMAATTVNKITITMTKPTVGKALPTDAQTSSTGSTQVTSVEWLGETDNGLMRANTAYSATIMVEIRPDKDAKFTTGTINATVNGGSTGVVVTRISDTQVRVRYNLSAAGTPVTAVTSFTIHTSVPKVGAALNKSASTTGSSNVEVTSVEWTGERDSNGHVKTDTAYTLTLNVKIKDGKNAMFSLRGTNAYINDTDTPATFTRLSDTTGIVTYTFPIISSDEREAEKKAQQEAQRAKEHAEELARRWSLAEADARVPLSDPITIVVNENIYELEPGYDAGYYDNIVRLGAPLMTLDGEVLPGDRTGYTQLRITGVVHDMYLPQKDKADHPAFTTLPNVKEIWLGPNCDIQSYLDTLPREMKKAIDHERNSFITYDKIVLIPASLYPNGPDFGSDGPPLCRVMLYDGDVYEAAKKGVSAARDWCTDHVYTAMLNLGGKDRVFARLTCAELSKAYYSCAKCGKIEYNPNHYFDANLNTIDAGQTTAHSYSDRILTDEHFLGINADGDRVYLYACEYCGKDKRYHDLNMTYEEFYKTSGETREAYELTMSRYKQWWAEGGNTYNKAIQATVDNSTHNCFAVSTATYVTAKTSGWAREDVNYASEEGLIDKALLGNDYTATINRLQFVSVAVKMTEKMTGKAITPAPAGTFTDTDNEYVRKAYAAGITEGVGNNAFDPNGTLTRQQMATFLYRALQYVKDNSDTEYSLYDSKLSSYSDAGQIESWAVDPMAFMNAFGLIQGMSDTTLAPKASCTIEQALIVALRSLDAGLLGWYQYDGDPFDTTSVGYKTHYTRYTSTGDVNWGTGIRLCTGERVFVTAITRNPIAGSYATSYYGEFSPDPYGRTAYIMLAACRAIKDR